MDKSQFRAKDLLKPFLWMLSFLYAGIVHVRNYLYDQGWLKPYVLPGSVISVGNMTTGGTGKTPLVMNLATDLIAEGSAPVVLTRGYKSGLKSNQQAYLINGVVVAGDVADKDFFGDEPRLISRLVPTLWVAVGARRKEAALRFLKENPSLKPTHWILDDGFQHRQLFRHKDVVLIDAKDPWSKGLLPFGHRREPLIYLRRANEVIFTRCEGASPTPAIQKQVASLTHGRQRKSYFTTRLPVLAWDPKKSYKLGKDGPFLLMCGIAKPEFFVSSIDQMGLREDVGETYLLKDHHRVNPSLFLQKLGDLRSIVTTAKDYARDPVFYNECREKGVRVFVCPLTVTLSPL